MTVEEIKTTLDGTKWQDQNGNVFSFHKQGDKFFYATNGNLGAAEQLRNCEIDENGILKCYTIFSRTQPIVMAIMKDLKHIAWRDHDTTDINSDKTLTRIDD